MPWWLALLLALLGLVAMAIGIGRGMRNKSEDLANTNRPMPPETFVGPGTGT